MSYYKQFRRRRCLIFTFSIILLFLGLFLILFWKNLFISLIRQQLTLANSDTYQYKYWLNTPVDINFEAYLFNWTNSKEFMNSKRHIKPKFEEIGPYIYTLRNHHTNILFNNDYTINYNNRRVWKFAPEKNNRSLDDLITLINPLAIDMSKIVKDKPFIIRRAINYFFVENDISLPLTKTVKEFLFDGVESPLINIALRLKLNGFDIPYDKFGFFYTRNNSDSYEGNFTMWTGADDIYKTGIMKKWNGKSKSSAYNDECSKIDGTSGEVWYPVNNDDTISLFFSDTCSKLTLDNVGNYKSQGIDGNLYKSTDKLYDNGEKYKEMACYSPGVRLPSGVRNLTDCQFKAPAFISLPHFNLADKSYRTAIEGMYPDKQKHVINFVIEPTYGFPLEVQAGIQINFRMYKVNDIDIFNNVKDTMIPMAWFHVTGGVPTEYVFLIKLMVLIPTIGTIFGYLLLILGLLLFFFGIFVELNYQMMSRIE